MSNSAAPLKMIHGTGNPNAKIFVLKDSPHFDEIRSREFLSHSAGHEFRKMLLEAGITSSDVYTSAVSLVYNQRPLYATKKKDSEYLTNPTKSGDFYIDQTVFDQLPRLQSEIEAVNPSIIVPIGAVALWLCAAESSIPTWRGSVHISERFNRKYICTYPPETILKVWAWRYQSVRDLQRVKHESEFRELRLPVRNFEIAPTFEQVMSRLNELKRLANLGG